jgi:hypothetical protein
MRLAGTTLLTDKARTKACKLRVPPAQHAEAGEALGIEQVDIAARPAFHPKTRLMPDEIVKAVQASIGRHFKEAMPTGCRPGREAARLGG